MDRLFGSLTAYNTAAAAKRAAEQQHQELMEEVCQGQIDLADLLLEHLHHLLAQALCPLGVDVRPVAPVLSAPACTIDDNEKEEEVAQEEEE